MVQKELITMTQKELSRYEVIKRLLNKEINGTDAAKQIGVSLRQIRNLKSKVKKYGAIKKINVKLVALTNRKPSQRKPPTDRPWRNQFLWDKIKKNQPVLIEK